MPAGNAKIADMEWAFGTVIAVMFGLYIWSHVTAGHRVGKKIQPFIDEVFGVSPSSEPESEGNRPPKPKASDNRDTGIIE
jgi:hypothetical protein